MTELPSQPASLVPRSVLVVDDERDLADQIARYLRFVGYEADVAYDAEEAIAKIDRDHHRVVITDLKMPGRQGDELLADLKRRDGTIQIIAMSGHVRVSRLINCLGLGACDCFSKPVNLEEMGVAVGEAFKRLDRWIRIMKGFCGYPPALDSPGAAGGPP